MNLCLYLFSYILSHVSISVVSTSIPPHMSQKHWPPPMSIIFSDRHYLQYHTGSELYSSRSLSVIVVLFFVKMDKRRIVIMTIILNTIKHDMFFVYIINPLVNCFELLWL